MNKFIDCFHESNYALFHPKKDKCYTCVGYDVGNVCDVDYQAHITKKNRGLEEKEKDKVGADKSIVVLTSDAESLMVSPVNNSNAMYYRTKLNFHNFTIYNLESRNVINYFWTEVDGNIESSHFASIYIDHLSSILDENEDVENIIMWSDGCSAQNRSSILSSALIALSAKYSVVIEQKYLEVGHTHMECDTVHARIEANKAKKSINIPDDYYPPIRTARKRGYGLKVVDWKFFKDYKSIACIKNIKPSLSMGFPLVTDIKALQYLPNVYLRYKLNFDDDWEELPRRVDKGKIKEIPKRLYTKEIPISASKFQHLQDLKSTINEKYHYDDLPHEQPKKGAGDAGGESGLSKKQQKRPKKSPTKLLKMI